MIAERDAVEFGQLLQKVYKTPDTEKVKLPAPAPETLELEDEVLIYEEETRNVNQEIHKSRKGTIAFAIAALLTAAGLAAIDYQVVANPYVSLDPGTLFWGFALAVGGAAVAGGLYLCLKPREFETVTKTVNAKMPRIRKRRIKVTVGQEDYPEKEVKLNTVQKMRKTESLNVDDGPSGHYIVFSVVLWGLASGVCVFPLLQGGARLNTQLVVAGHWVAALLVAGGFLGFYHIKRIKRKTRQVKKSMVAYEEKTRIESLKVNEKFAPVYEDRIIPNPEKVVGFGILDFPLEAVPFREGTLLVDGDELTPGVSVRMPVIEDREKAHEHLDALRLLAENVPAILSVGHPTEQATGENTAFGRTVPLKGEESELMTHFNEITSIYADVEHQEFTPNVLDPAGPLAGLMVPSDAPKRAASLANPDLARLIDIAEDDHNQHLYTGGNEFIETWRVNNAVLSGVRFQSLYNRISPAMLEFGHISHYASFNFYCPYCNEAQVKDILSRDYAVSSAQETIPIRFSPNSRCTYDLDTGTWECPACERSIEDPIPVHKMLDEVLHPTYDRLVAENQPARFELDNKTRDDELAYTNEMHREMDALMHELKGETQKIQNEIEMTQARVIGHQKAISSFQDIMGGYQAQQSQALQKINDHSAELAKKIDEDKKQVLTQVNAALEQRLVEYQEQMRLLSLSKRKEDMVRDAVQVGVLENMVAARRSLGNIEVHTSRTADATEESAAHLAVVRDNTGKALHHLNNIDDNTGRAAAATERTATASEQAAQKLGTIEKNTAQTAEGIGSLGQQMERGNAIQAAIAGKHGVDVNDHSFWRIDKKVAKMGAEIKSSLTGASSAERARDIGRAVQ